MIFAATALGGEGSDLREAPTLIVGVESYDYAPYYTSENGNYSGFCRDVLDLFAARMGYKLTIRAHPYLRLVVELIKGDIDVEFPDDIDWLPEKKAGHDFQYSNKVLNYVDGVARLSADLGKPIGTLKVIAMPRGWWPADYLPLAKQGLLRIEEEPSVEATAKSLLSGHVDGVYLSEDVVEYFFRSIHREGEAHLDRSLPYKTGSYHMSTIRHPEAIADFNRFLENSQTEIAALRAKYRIGDSLP